MTCFHIVDIRGLIEGPWSVGGVQLAARRTVARCGSNDEVVLPATSLAGSLKAYLSAGAAPVGVDPHDLMGGNEVPPDPGDPVIDDSAGLPLQPSWLWSGPVTLSAKPAVERRTRTAIDAWRGAAKGQHLFDVEEVWDPSGTAFRWVLIMQTDKLGAVDDICKAIAGWRPLVGSGRSIGRGTASLLSVTDFPVDLGQQEPLTWWLTERGEWCALGPGNQRAAIPKFAETVVERRKVPGYASDLTLLKLLIVEPIHVGVGLSSGPQKVFRRSSRESDRPVAIVPGSSWKGIFRHRCGYILRVCGADEAEVANVQDALFGRSPAKPKRHGRRLPHEAGLRGRLRFRDSEVTASAELERTHVAIDRISGGAADEKLFTWEAVAAGSLELRIDGVSGLGEPIRNLLDHVVADLHDGLIGVGGGVTRGYGAVRCADRPPSPRPVEYREVVEWAKEQLGNGWRAEV